MFDKKRMHDCVKTKRSLLFCYILFVQTYVRLPCTCTATYALYAVERKVAAERVNRSAGA